MAFRPNFSKPNLLYYLRCFQLCFSLGFLIVICYAGVHRAWWDNVTGTIAVGVISSIATFAIIGHAIFTQIRSNPFSSRGSIYQIARLVVEVVTFLLWVATVVLMLRHKGGCDNRHAIDGQDRCYDHVGDGFKVYTDQPTTQWFVGVAFDLVEWLAYPAPWFGLKFADDPAAVSPLYCPSSSSSRTTAPTRSLAMDRATHEESA